MDVSTLERHALAMLRKPLTLKDALLEVSDFRIDRRKTKQFVKSIPTDQVEMFRESTENCRAFLELVQRHVDDMTKRGIREIEREAKDARRKAKAPKRANS